MTEGDAMAVAGEAQLPVDAIHQCVDCQRQHDGRGTVTVFKFGLPVLVACGRSDCATVAAALKLEESQRIEGQKQRAWKPLHDRRRQLINEKLHPPESKPKHGKHQRDVGSNRGFRSSCTPELARSPVKEDSRDPDPEPEAREAAPGTSQRDVPTLGTARDGGAGVLPLRPASAEPTHQERQRLFAAEGKGDNQNELMLDLLLKEVHPEFPRGFDMAAVPRVGRGGWISKAELIHEHFIDTPNSRASELRGSETHPGHVLVNRWQLEIDNSSDGSVTGQPGGVSCYSVCFREHSYRIARERQAEQKGQQSLV